MSGSQVFFVWSCWQTDQQTNNTGGNRTSWVGVIKAAACKEIRDARYASLPADTDKYLLLMADTDKMSDNVPVLQLMHIWGWDEVSKHLKKLKKDRQCLFFLLLLLRCLLTNHKPTLNVCSTNADALYYKFIGYNFIIGWWPVTETFIHPWERFAFPHNNLITRVILTETWNSFTLRPNGQKANDTREKSLLLHTKTLLWTYILNGITVLDLWIALRRLSEYRSHTAAL